jgi:hypothetical protein
MKQNKIIQISNRNELIAYLEQEGNSYSNFILERIDRSSIEKKGNNVHHIIPRHMGGPDAEWNYITLTLEEHIQAHSFLYEDYQKLADLSAVQMLKGHIDLGTTTIRKMAQDKMRKEKTGFFNSDLQRALALRPKKRREPYARNECIAAALARGFTLEYIPSGEILIIEPFECPNVVYVIEKLMLHPKMKKQRESWDASKNKNKYYAVTALTRILSGHIDQRTGRRLFSFNEWRVLGINCFIE